MSRTANTIKMAAMLRKDSPIKNEEIAKALNTNPRNVREYANELRTAGIDVKYKSGRYGGYFLGKDSKYIIRESDEYCDKFDCPMNIGGYCEG